MCYYGYYCFVVHSLRQYAMTPCTLQYYQKVYQTVYILYGNSVDDYTCTIFYVARYSIILLLQITQRVAASW